MTHLKSSSVYILLCKDAGLFSAGKAAFDFSSDAYSSYARRRKSKTTQPDGNKTSLVYSFTTSQTINLSPSTLNFTSYPAKDNP